MPSFRHLSPGLAGCLFLPALLVALPAAAGDDWDISWHTVDGGGEVFSSGGEFELSGTIGQWDATEAGELAGGGWRLTGGFWSLTREERDDLLFSDRFEDDG